MMWKSDYRVEFMTSKDSITPELYGIAARLCGVTLDVCRCDTGLLGLAVDRLRNGADQIVFGGPYVKHAHVITRCFSPQARITGYCNCLTRKGDGIEGHDSRPKSIARTMHAIKPGSWMGRKVLVLGLGGPAIAAVLAAKVCKEAEVQVANMNGVGITLRREVGTDMSIDGAYVDRDGPFEYDLVIDAGEFGYAETAQHSVLPRRYHRKGAHALALSYDPLEPLFLKHAREAGCEVTDAVLPTAYRVADVFEHLTGKTPPEQAYIAECRDAFLRRAKR